MQNRSIFPYRRHGPKKRVKHGSNKSRGPQKGLPNSARDLLPMLQPATKALAQVLAGRAGASGQLGHARTMLAQAERLIGERAHNRLAPAEREEFFEQLARLKLTLADADAEAEVQAEEQEVERAAVPPVARERLKEMALALSMPQRPGPESNAAVSSAAEAASGVGRATPQDEVAAQDNHDEDTPRDEESQASETGRSTAATPGDRLVLPKARADQVAQAVSFGGIARRRSRAASRGTATPAAGAADEPAERHKVGMMPKWGTQTADDDDAGAETAAVQSTGEEPESTARRPVRLKAISRNDEAHHDNGAVADDGAAEDDGEDRADPDNGTAPKARTASRAKTVRRTRKPKHKGLPEGWVIDEEGFVVPAAD
jgi:hypothetical protein